MGEKQRDIKSKFHENKDWNDLPCSHRYLEGSSRASSTKTRIETLVLYIQQKTKFHIKSKFHENKDWNLFWAFRYAACHFFAIKSKFHENKDWNGTTAQAFMTLRTSRASSTKTRIETPVDMKLSNLATSHQEQVPRKQGLKLIGHLPGLNLPVDIKSKFHENKDWNSHAAKPFLSMRTIKSKFHENKDWNLCKK